MTMGRHADDLTLVLKQPPAKPASVYQRFAAQLNPQIFQTSVALRIARNDRYAGPVPVVDWDSGLPGLRLPTS